MGIFSLFGKKQGRPGPKLASSTPASEHADKQPVHTDPASNLGRSSAADERRQAAQATATATALKIDAIESEMSSEFVRPQGLPAISTPAAITAEATATGNTLFLTDTVLLGSGTEVSLEESSLIEQVAILFADGQSKTVEQLLEDAIDADSLGSASLMVWAMLFDVYQISGDQAKFDHLSIAYASRFESSPPAWAVPATAKLALETSPRVLDMPSVAFIGQLDADISKPLEKIQVLALKHPAIRLEFSKITGIDPVGCSMLLPVLQHLKKAGTELTLIGATELVTQIKLILVAERRDKTEGPWLLLLELLNMMNMESAFEEASIDYCITFEVSPPAFSPPKNKIAVALEPPAMSEIGGQIDANSFIMPALIEGRADSLVTALGNFVSEHNPAFVDCAVLERIDVNAAAQLLSGVATFAAGGRSIEFIHVNHLVAALFDVLGFREVVRITTTKI